MKINWGTGLAIGMVLFIAFIMFMVITMSTDDRYDYDLVTEEYYKKELAYQQEIDAETNLKDFSKGIVGTKVAEGWQLTFPDDMDIPKLKGTVFLYRPSNKQLDFDLPIEVSGSNLLIPDERFLDGRWNITMAMTYNGKNYLYKAEITY
ncbi:MAG: cytochrome C oxidase Cbb3 [Altibacter sp.]|nr:FixH family protein [Altibacter sp.]MAP55055.1 cytochrome C oxidase Cbb3 [Altibacter sp.]|tara:strand:+ start:59 stop:505 length:447 start_codon:yes stop_codon:yes gene_type:complete